MSYFNVDYYVGHWKNDKKGVKGIMKYNNGDFKNDLILFSSLNATSNENNNIYKKQK